MYTYVQTVTYFLNAVQKYNNLFGY